eukprot:Rmarinus@m.9511
MEEKRQVAILLHKFLSVIREEKYIEAQEVASAILAIEPQNETVLQYKLILSQRIAQLEESSGSDSEEDDSESSSDSDDGSEASSSPDETEKQTNGHSAASEGACSGRPERWNPVSYGLKKKYERI